jgi:adenylate kinase family enzyme
MDKKTTIFMGRSGCGKGTQAKIYVEALKKNDSERAVLYSETGALFRGFVVGSGYSQGLAREIMEKGGREPDFLAVYLWGRSFIEKLTGNEHLIIDGSPRSLGEAKMLDTALSFYGKVADVVYLDVSREWSLERLRERGRADDKDLAENEKRMNWFESDVMPAVLHYQNHPIHKFFPISGEKSIAEVAADIEKQVPHGNI